MAVNRETNYDINDVLGMGNTSGFADESLFGEDTLDPTNTLLLGATQRTSTAFGRTATVKAGEDIRPALESLKSAGGGTLILLAGVHQPSYDIEGGSKINIVGEGRDQTIVDFGGGTYSVLFKGTSSTPIENFSIKDITIKNGFNGLDIDFANYFTIEKVLTSDFSRQGIEIDHSSYWLIDDLLSNNNTQDGLRIRVREDGSFVDTKQFSVRNSAFEDNSGDGFSIMQGDSNATSNGIVEFFTVDNCLAHNNGTYGFVLDNIDTFGNISNGTFSNCRATSNTLDGFRNDANTFRISYLYCYANANGSDGFDVNGSQILVGCISDDAFRFPTGSQSVNTISMGNKSSLGVGDLGSEGFIKGDSVNYLNFDGSPKTEQRFLRLRNASGSTRTLGEVAVFDPTGSYGIEGFTTTTTAGDKKVAGVIYKGTQSTINTTAGAYISIEGFVDNLKVNGTTDIAVGDELSTFTSAGIAKKAASGDVVFAIALEAYTTDDSNGVIDAYIIPWRYQLP